MTNKGISIREQSSALISENKVLLVATGGLEPPTPAL